MTRQAERRVASYRPLLDAMAKDHAICGSDPCEFAALILALRKRGVVVRTGMVRHQNCIYAACISLEPDRVADDEDEIPELYTGVDLTPFDGQRVRVIVERVP